MSAARSRLEVHVSVDGDFYWLLRAPNGRVLCNGETHGRELDARRSADITQRALVPAFVAGPHYWTWHRRGEAGFWSQRGDKTAGPRRGAGSTETLQAWRWA